MPNPNEQVIELRTRILGIMIRNARERTRTTNKECADLLGISTDNLEDIESGIGKISLPELELLGRFLGVPLHILRDDDPARAQSEIDMPDAEFYLPLRDRIIGAQLRKARLAAGYTQEELAELVGHSASTISAYEYGKREIPLAELELLSRALGASMEEFVDADSDMGIWHHLQEDFERFVELPSEMREFVLRPINQSYLELAMRLASMPAGALRQIAEGLLEITY